VEVKRKNWPLTGGRKRKTRAKKLVGGQLTIQKGQATSQHPLGGGWGPASNQGKGTAANSREEGRREKPEGNGGNNRPRVKRRWQKTHWPCEPTKRPKGKKNRTRPNVEKGQGKRLKRKNCIKRTKVKCGGRKVITPRKGRRGSSLNPKRSDRRRKVGEKKACRSGNYTNGPKELGPFGGAMRRVDVRSPFGGEPPCD